MAGVKVLLVDDEVDFVEALSARLETRGLTVDVANSGVVAVQKAGERSYDAIVLDLAMPGMDGIETLRALKERQADVNVILLTGQASVKKGIEAMKLGAMDLFEKPVDINVLLEKIHEARSNIDEAKEEKTRQIIEDILKTKGW